MGVKNYSQQMKLIQFGLADSRKVKDYAESINTLIGELDSVWKGGMDKCNILTAMGDCAKEAGQIANKYYTFCDNSKRWLDEINRLDKTTIKVSPKVICTITCMMASSSSKMQMDIDSMRAVAKKMLLQGQKLEGAHSRGIRIFNGLDSMILCHFPDINGKNGISNRIGQLQQKNNRIAYNIIKVCELYEKADTNVQNKIGAGADLFKSVGTLQSIIESTKSAKTFKKKKVESKEDIIAYLENKENKTETEKQILKELKKKTKVDDIEKALKVKKQVEKKDYIGAFTTIWDKWLVGKLSDGQTAGLDFDALKRKSVTYLLQIVKGTATEKGKFSYLVKNLHKYESAGGYRKFETAKVATAAALVQVLGKGVVDVSCRLINDAIHATPAGKILDLEYAIMKDVTGTNPGMEFNKVTKKVSDAVDDFFDGQVKDAEKRDEIRLRGEKELKKVVKQAISGTEVKSATGGGTSW